MNKQQLLNRLGYFADPTNGIGCVLYFVLEIDGEPVVKFADIEDDAKHELKNRFIEYIHETFFGNEDLQFVNISTADDCHNAVYHYDISEKTKSLTILEDILVNEHRPPFVFSEHRLNEVKGYLITIGNERNKIALYKKHHPVNLLRQDRFLLIPNNQRLEKIKNDAIALDKSFDFMMVDDHLIVLKLNTLERFFGFEQVIRNQAQNTINVVQENDLMEDISQLCDLAENLSNARKLMRMRHSPVLNVPVSDVINFIRNHPELAGRIAFNADGTKVKLTTGVSKKLFLKLLNDDYLFSQLTELQYDSHAKGKLNGNGSETGNAA